MSALVVLASSLFSLASAHAQVANCPFNVSATSPMPSPQRFTADGVILSRYARGVRGSALYSNVSTATAAEALIAVNEARLDLDGDGAFTATDALIAARYLAGFSSNTWLTGVDFTGTAATRRTATEIESLMEAGCPRATATEAARFLQQATFGANLTEIQRVQTIGLRAWLDEQFSLPAPSPSYSAYAAQIIAENKQGLHGCTDPVNMAYGCPWAVNEPTFYKAVFEGDDQLRQRVINALLQILVVSLENGTINDAGTAMPNYMDMLGANAFGNFRTLLRDVTLHPAMGIYLDMLGSTGRAPNENYARELLQLFSIGTVMLNPDGTPQRDAANKTVPTYSETDVQELSRALTGWHFANQIETQPWRYYWPERRWTTPMTPWTGRLCPQDGRWPSGSTTQWCDVSDPARSYPPPHDTGSKNLLSYPGAVRVLPANQTPAKDVEDAIDNIFNHPNVGPFIGRQLIQRLVTSNPTPAYVARVTSAFNNNGSGVRGDMKAVLRAILLDVEARGASVAAGYSFGKLREPVLKFTQFHRAFSATQSTGYYGLWALLDPESLNQAPMHAPSVFNYYSPDHVPTGAPMSTAKLQGPEFEIANAATVAGFASFSGWGILGGFLAGDAARWIKPNHDRYLVGSNALADSPQALVDELDLLLTAGNLKSDFKASLVTMVAGITRTSDNNDCGTSFPALDCQRRQRLRALLWQVLQSTDYAVQR